MAMTREEREFAKQVSDETMEDRRKAIAAAGPLFNAARQDTLERMLGQDCRLAKPDVATLMGKFAEAGDNDENDLAAIKTSIRTALDPLVTNKKFLAREVEEIAKQVEAARVERDRKIVASGGPDRPKLMMFMS